MTSHGLTMRKHSLKALPYIKVSDVTDSYNLQNIAVTKFPKSYYYSKYYQLHIMKNNNEQIWHLVYYSSSLILIQKSLKESLLLYFKEAENIILKQSFKYINSENKLYKLYRTFNEWIDKLNY